MEALKNKEVLVNETIVFHVIDCSIELASSDTSYGWKTIGIIGGQTHYLGDELINLETALNLYQSINNRMLSKEEVQYVVDENTLKLGY